MKGCGEKSGRRPLLQCHTSPWWYKPGLTPYKWGSGGDREADWVVICSCQCLDVAIKDGSRNNRWWHAITASHAMPLSSSAYHSHTHTPVMKSLRTLLVVTQKYITKVTLKINANSLCDEVSKKCIVTQQLCNTILIITIWKKHNC